MLSLRALCHLVRAVQPARAANNLPWASSALRSFSCWHGGSLSKACANVNDATAFRWSIPPAYRELVTSGSFSRCFSAQPASKPAQPKHEAASTRPEADAGAEKKVDSLEITEETYSALAAQIPQKPMGVVESTSYSLIILAAFAFLAVLVYQFVTNMILVPVSQQCFETALEKLKGDPRITVRLGSDIQAWGQNAQSRGRWHQIPHTIYKTEDGVEHVRLQFHMGGAGGVALCSADMFKSGDRWEYLYLVVDVLAQGSQHPQRLFIVTP